MKFDTDADQLRYSARTMQMTHAVRRYQKREPVSAILLGEAIERTVEALAAERARADAAEALNVRLREALELAQPFLEIPAWCKVNIESGASEEYARHFKAWKAAQDALALPAASGEGVDLPEGNGPGGWS